MPRSTDQALHGDRLLGLVPSPDPTLLTTAQLDRAITNLDSRLTTRLEGMDKAAELLHADFTRVPTDVDRQISHLRELLEAKIDKFVSVTHVQFAGIEAQFSERDKRFDLRSLTDRTALGAALQAQKESAIASNDSIIAVITKMDASFTKLFDQTQTLLQAVTRNTDDKINDLKSRLDKGEGKTSVSDPAIADAIKIMTSAFASLKESAGEAKGHNKGITDSWGILAGFATLILGGVAILELVARLH